MKKAILTFILALVVIATYAQTGLGLVTRFQITVIDIGTETVTSEIIPGVSTATVWRNKDAIVVWTTDGYAWEDRVVDIKEDAEPLYVDLDGDGRNEMLRKTYYYTDSNLMYSFTYQDGILVAVSTETHGGDTIIFMGHIDTKMLIRPRIVNGEVTVSR